jgi:acetaldehyde dehydrogenase
MSNKTRVAIIGSGNIGTDLMIKVLRISEHLEMAAMVGIDPESDGLARAKRMGVPTTSNGLDGLIALDGFDDIDIVFDATSAAAHQYVVPAVNLDEHLGQPNLNMVTCGGQATIPIVAAVSRVSTVHYAEIVASISSKSAGPGTRANIDEFTETTSKAIEVVGGAEMGKAIIVLNPAEPPLVMRDTVFCLCDQADEASIVASIEEAVAAVSSYVSGYRLKQRVQIDPVGVNEPLRIPDMDREFEGLKVSVFLEVEGAAHYLPSYAGNLDIMTSAALQTAERLAQIARRVTSL